MADKEIHALCRCLHTVAIKIDEERILEERRVGGQWVGMTAAFQNCTRLVEISVVSEGFQEEAVCDEWVGPMFADPMETLKNISMKRPMCITDSKLPTIGNATGSLKSIEVVLNAVFDPSSDLKPLVDANPNLKKVVLVVKERSPNLEIPFRIAQQVVLLCGNCKNLEWLHLWLGVDDENQAVRLNVNGMQLPQSVYRNVDFEFFVDPALEQNGMH